MLPRLIFPMGCKLNSPGKLHASTPLVILQLLTFFSMYYYIARERKSQQYFADPSWRRLDFSPRCLFRASLGSLQIAKQTKFKKVRFQIKKRELFRGEIVFFCLIFDTGGCQFRDHQIGLFLKTRENLVWHEITSDMPNILFSYAYKCAGKLIGTARIFGAKKWFPPAAKITLTETEWEEK